MTKGFCKQSVLLWFFVCTCLQGTILLGQDSNRKDVSISLRPKVGPLFALEGDLSNVFDGLICGEIGLKGTYDHLGLEFSVGGMGDGDWRTGTGDNFHAHVSSGFMNLMCTYEFFPKAVINKKTGDVNAYLGGGVGYYPLDYDWKGKSHYYHGVGFHGIVGAECCLQKHVSTFFEYRYSTFLFDKGSSTETLDMRGSSVFLGLSFGF